MWAIPTASEGAPPVRLNRVVSPTRDASSAISCSSTGKPQAVMARAACWGSVPTMPAASYLAALRAELADSDPAMVQDALADAEEFARAERDGLAGAGSEPSDAALAARLVERFGSPREVARSEERRV